MNDSEKYCLSLLRGGDYDRYISVLFAPQDKRGSLAALYAFNLELVRTGDAVKEPLAGEIRLRWWRDRIETGSGEGQSPVLTALFAAIKCHGLPFQAFLRMCDARIFDLYHDAMPGRTDLEGYYGDTVALVMQLACQILDREAASRCADACGHGGVAQGISGLLRLLPVTTRRDQLYIPQDILVAVGATRAALRAPVPDIEARRRVVSAMLALAYEHYGAFAAAVENTPASVQAAFLPLAAVPACLKQAETLGSWVFEDMAGVSRLRRQWLIGCAALTGRFRHKT
jgi:phytoene synthase